MSESNTNEHEPQFLPPGDAASQASQGEGGEVPAFDPPDEAASHSGQAPEGPASGAISAATWIKGKKLAGLWSRDQTRNAFLHDVGGKWRKLSNQDTTGFVALGLLALHAHQTGRTLDFKEEGGQIVEIYAW